MQGYHSIRFSYHLGTGDCSSRWRQRRQVRRSDGQEDLHSSDHEPRPIHPPRGPPKLLNRWWAPEDGEEITTHQHYEGLGSNSQLLLDMGIWRSDTNTLDRWYPRGCRFCTPTQLALLIKSDAADATLIWNRATAALEFYFGTDVKDAFLVLWEQNSGASITWEPARELRRLLEIPRAVIACTYQAPQKTVASLAQSSSAP